jgi:flagellar biosynthesis GTPase FlhF
MATKTTDEKITKKKGGKISWIISVAVILYGLIIWSYSPTGSILLILAGLFLLPPIKSSLLARFNGILSKPLWINAIAVILLAGGFSLSGTAITNRNLADWNANKTELSQRLTNSIESKRFKEADEIIGKFSSSVKGDPVFDELKAKYEEAKAQYDAEMKAKAEAEMKARMEAEEKEKQRIEEEQRLAAAARQAQERLAAARQAQERLAAQPVSITMICRGNYFEIVHTYVSLMDSGQIGNAVDLLRLNGCQPPTLNDQSIFTRGNSEVVREGRGFVAIRLTGQQIYAVTTIGAWMDP